MAKSRKELKVAIDNLEMKIRHLQDLLENIIDIKITELEDREKKSETKIDILTQEHKRFVASYTAADKNNTINGKVCKKMFETKELLNQHNFNSHTEAIKNQKTKVKKLNITKTSHLECYQCENTFVRFSDLESHIKATHKAYEEFKCDKCSKTFVTTWRLRKHERIHTDKSIRPCRFFTNKEECPFDDLGCKFLHLLPYPQQSSGTSGNGMHGDIDDAIEETELEENNAISFVSSTPKSKNEKCENCLDEWECVKCLIKSTLGTKSRRLLTL